MLMFLKQGHADASWRQMFKLKGQKGPMKKEEHYIPRTKVTYLV